jgi:hypothetical protein
MSIVEWMFQLVGVVFLSSGHHGSAVWYGVLPCEGGCGLYFSPCGRGLRCFGLVTCLACLLFCGSRSEVSAISVVRVLVAILVVRYRHMVS